MALIMDQWRQGNSTPLIQQEMDYWKVQKAHPLRGGDSYRHILDILDGRQDPSLCAGRQGHILLLDMTELCEIFTLICG